MGKILGKALHEEIKKKFGFRSDSELAKFMGIKSQNISNYNKMELTEKSIVNRYVKKFYEIGKSEGISSLKNGAIRKIIEYAPIVADQKTNYFINPPGTQYDYKRILSEKKGIYIFYGSLYTPIYVGKTEKQDLWKEMGIAYNNKEIRSHHRICNKSTVKIKDVAHYISAYEVQEEIISLVEAIMIRSFINVLNNIKSEKIPDIKYS